MDITIGGILVLVIFTYYTLYMTTFLFKDKRNEVINKSKKLNELRKIRFKTLKEQKQFLELRYPKRQKFKLTWKKVIDFVFRIFVFLVVFRLYMFFLQLTGWNIKLWQGVLVLILLPIILNSLLEKFNLQKNDLRVFFR